MSQGAVIDAINNRSVLTFYYKNKVRTVEPHLLGYDQDGDLTLSAWQLSGGSGVGFRNYHLRILTSLATTGQTFAGARYGYNRNDPNFRRILARL